MTAIASGAPTLRAPAMVSNASCVSEGLRELTDEELDLVAGASFWGGFRHFVVDVVKGAGEGEIAGAATGAITGPGVGPAALAGSIGGAIYGAFNFLNH
jgi:hypothetical protein